MLGLGKSLFLTSKDQIYIPMVAKEYLSAIMGKIGSGASFLESTIQPRRDVSCDVSFCSLAQREDLGHTQPLSAPTSEDAEAAGGTDGVEAAPGYTTFPERSPDCRGHNTENCGGDCFA